MKFKEYLLLAVIPLHLISCTNGGNAVVSNSTENTKVIVLKISSQPHSSKLKYSGSIEPDNIVRMGFAIPGIINKVLVNEGQYVKKGQLLATIDNTEYRNSLLISEAALTQTEDLYKRLKELYDKESLPEKDFIEVKTKLAQARASRDINTKKINDSRLYAPMSGFITEKAIEPGSTANPALPAFSIIKTDQVYAQFTVPEEEIGQINDSQPADIYVTTLKDSIKGKVSIINPQADAQTRTYKVKILLNNSNGKLLPGMLLIISVRAERAKNNITVPATAIVRDEDDLTYVFIVGNHNRAIRRRVIVGDLDGDQVIINSGLQENDQVVISGQSTIKDGQSVTITGA